ncbi:MAG: glycosyltransferase family 4 protein [Oscillospiraceae bacterium]|nr:glycosyltransferase family 4 protein [Oscillospiraceae bacterium]
MRFRNFAFIAVFFIICLTIFTLVIFTEPIVGVADQGDFSRVFFGIERPNSEIWENDHFFRYVVPEYNLSPFPHSMLYFRPPVVSQIYFVYAGRLLSRAIGLDYFNQYVYAIFTGIIYILGLISIYFALLPKKTIIRVLLASGLIFIFMDGRWIQWFNSLYGEPIVMTGILLTIGAFLLIEKFTLLKKGTPALLIIMLFFAEVVMVGGKIQAVALILTALILNGFISVMIWKSAVARTWAKWAKMALLSALTMLLLYYCSGVPGSLEITFKDTLYQSVFKGLLLNADDPEMIIGEWQLDPAFINEIGNSAYMPDDFYTFGPIQGELMQEKFFSKVTRFTVLEYYATHPADFYKGLVYSAEKSLQVPNNGIHPRGYELKTEHGRFTVWTDFRRSFPKNFLFLASFLAVAITVSIVLFKRKRHSRAVLIWALSAGGCTQFVMPYLFNGTDDTAKQLMIFTYIFDILLFTLVATLIEEIYRRRAVLPQTPQSIQALPLDSSALPREDLPATLPLQSSAAMQQDMPAQQEDLPAQQEPPQPQSSDALPQEDLPATRPLQSLAAMQQDVPAPQEDLPAPQEPPQPPQGFRAPPIERERQSSMNVLYLINFAGRGGSERYVVTLAQNLQSVANLFFAYNVDGPLVPEMAALCMKTERIEMRSPFDIRAARQLAIFLRENDIDIVHAQYPRENYIAILARNWYRKVKIIYTAHWNIKDRFLRRVANRLFTRANSAALAVSESCAEQMKNNGYLKSRIRVIYPGTKIDLTDGDCSLPVDINIPEEVFVFVCLARLSEEKGLRFLIESAAHLKRSGQMQFVVLIAGVGEQRAELEQLRADLRVFEEIRLLGYRDDCGAILSGADAYISSSRTESFGFGVVEALAHGLPVIATDVGGSRDIIGNSYCFSEEDREEDRNGKSFGILVPYGDIEAMARAMEEMMSLDRTIYARLAVNARREAETRFSEEVFAQRVFDEYKAALKSNIPKE